MSVNAANYNVDLVQMIDGTGSMRPWIETVKANALTFYEDLRNRMAAKSKVIGRLRIRTIVFRDYYEPDDDPAEAMTDSGFIELPGEQDDFERFITAIQAKGGGDIPENAIEAMVMAMRSKWTQGGKSRHIMVVWTDAPAHPLEKNWGSKPDHYPAAMPANIDDLTDLWGTKDSQEGMDYFAKRLILFAPDVYPWNYIDTHWEQVIQHISTAGKGLSDMDYSTILDVIVNSIVAGQ